MGHPHIVFQLVAGLVNEVKIGKVQNIIGGNTTGSVLPYLDLGFDVALVRFGGLRIRGIRRFRRFRCSIGNSIGNNHIGVIQTYIITWVRFHSGVQTGIDRLYRLTVPGDTDVVIADGYSLPCKGSAVSNADRYNDSRAAGREIHTSKHIRNADGTTVPLIAGIVRDIAKIGMSINAVAVDGSIISECISTAAQLQTANTYGVMGDPHIIFQAVACLVGKGAVSKPQNIIGQDAAGSIFTDLHCGFNILTVIRLFRLRLDCCGSDTIGNRHSCIVQRHIIRRICFHCGIEAGIDGLNGLPVTGDSDIVIAHLYGLAGQGSAIRDTDRNNDGRAASREINTRKNIRNADRAAVPLIVSIVGYVTKIRMGIDAVGIDSTAVPEGQTAAAQLQAANAANVMGGPDIVLQTVARLVGKGAVSKPQDIIGQNITAGVCPHFHRHFDELTTVSRLLRLRFHSRSGNGIRNGHVGVV